MDLQIPRNPFITSIFTADPSAHSFDGETVYVYASHDMDPPRGCDLMDKYHVFSSKDMVNWTDEGEILNSDGVGWGRQEGGFMWAPDCVLRDGVYYFYYPHPSGTNWNDTWKIGVATSNHPHKDFTDRGYIQGLGGFALIDPCVFVDDDGQAYIYIGGGARCQGAKLNADMMSLQTQPEDMAGLYDFHEAAWVFKRGGLYYISYSDNTQPENHMRYAVSESPLGPWTHKGAYMDPVGCETTHGSVMEFKGQWYQFYHNQDISKMGNLRSICVDKLFFDDNGDILPVKQTRDGIRNNAAPENTAWYGVGPVIKNIAGNEEGRATVWIKYETREQWTKLRLAVNGNDESFLNCLASEGAARLTVRLKPGLVNEIAISEVSEGLRITDIGVGFLDE
jgi:beta-xylosidase